MKLGRFPLIIIILVAAFGIAFVLSSFVQFGPNGPYISGCVGPCTAQPTQLVVTANPSSIYVNVATNDPSIVQSTTLTVNDAISSCGAASIYWQSDIPGFFINKTGGTATTSYPYCTLNSTSCSCTIQFHSLNAAGTANIFASDKSHPNTTSPGGTQVTINWPSACVGVATPCSNSALFKTATLCAAQHSCTWFNPTTVFSPSYCAGGYTSCGYYTNASYCTAHEYCYWYAQQGALYPMCGGTISYNCSQLSGNITTCLGDKRCLYNSATSTCYDNKCSVWNSDSATCNSIGGCNYTTSPCAGTVLSCTSFTDQGSCAAQNGCSWAGFNPSSQPCHSVTGTTYFNSTPCASLSGTSCSNQVGCAWTSNSSTCTGNNNYTCSSFNSQASNCNNAKVNGVNVCSYDYATNKCNPVSCGTWNGNATNCQSSVNCTFNLINTCIGNSKTCDVFNGNQNACQSQSGCQWGTTVPLVTTTTTSTTSTSTTSTSTSTTTTTSPPAPLFNATGQFSPFNCLNTSLGPKCYVNTTNNLGENAQILFKFSIGSGDVVGYSVGDAPQGIGSASGVLPCPTATVPVGSYYVLWAAYRASDTNLATPIAWTNSTLRQTVVCSSS